MVRRVKAYLKNMKVITDEEKLHAMSLECEPPVGGSAPLASSTAATQLPPPSVRKVIDVFDSPTLFLFAS